MNNKRYFILVIVFLFLMMAVTTTQFSAFAWSALDVVDDPLVRMPGTQPGDIPEGLTDSSQCGSCHQTQDNSVSITHDWTGSMMGQAARDFLFWATMTVATQDSIWALGNPNATDICIRCHFPLGWVNGRSDPTNASLMTGNDYDGVQCTICHYMVDPFFEDTAAGSREGADWSGYWDETNGSTTPSNVAASATLTEDRLLAETFSLFNGDPFFDLTHRPPITFTESGSGQYFLDNQDHRRASFADADARHGILYSRYHKSKYYCSTCHDISNPALANLNDNPTQPLTTETDAPYSYFHVERTFSEFMLSDFGQQGGAAGIGPFNPSEFETSQPGNLIASCQDCHMRDTVGEAVNNTILRPTESTEHPHSGQPMHDLTGGNVWVPTILASIDLKGPNHDVVNEGLLNDRAAELTLDFKQGSYFDAEAILDGANRSLDMLQNAAVITDVLYSPYSGNLRFIVQNQTGHKLISGFPEGRRMFVNIKYFDETGTLMHEVNPYDEVAGTLKGLSYPYTTTLNLPADLTSNEIYVDELVYEMHGSSSLTGEDETFHFVLSDGRYKDNRIPPKGFRIDEADGRLSEPVQHGVPVPDYFTTEEYAGGYDQVSMRDFDILVTGAVTVEVTLNYQTTSREYIEFLRDEINGSGTLTLPSPGAGGDPAYLIQDPSQTFFAGMRVWGDTIWSLWIHNMNAPGAAPINIASRQFSPSLPPLFDYDIKPGDEGSPRWNAIAMPLDDTVSIPNAQAIADQISGAQQVLRWNPTRQDFDFWLPPFQFGTNFTTNLGDSYMVLVDNTAPLVFTVIGDLPPATGNPGALQYNLVGSSPCQFNAVTIPFDLGNNIFDAQDLADSIGNVDQILNWNPVRQDFDFWLPSFQFGTNFNVNAGNPYMVCTTIARVWP